MGYACPVCDDPQADAGHLANHLAFTAITSGGDHEEWLDERVSDWEQLGEDELADRIVDEAEETEFPQVFEASNVDGHDHGVDVDAARSRGGGELDEEAAAIMEEAREMTMEMRDGADDDDEEDGAGANGDNA